MHIKKIYMSDSDEVKQVHFQLNNSLQISLKKKCWLLCSPHSEIRTIEDRNKRTFRTLSLIWKLCKKNKLCINFIIFITSKHDLCPYHYCTFCCYIIYIVKNEIFLNHTCTIISILCFKAYITCEIRIFYF
jgi:hypothetical protein